LIDDNVMLYYGLATPVETDISDLLTWDGSINVEAQGLVEFVNANNLPVPSDVKCYVKRNVVNDVQIDGTSISENGVANIPIADRNTLGVVRVNSNYGVYLKSADKVLSISSADASNIAARANAYKSITPSVLNTAVKAALTDANRDTTYTDEEKANACDTIGAWRRPSDGWVLKGTITNGESSVAVDLNGCTELTIMGRGTATSTVSITSNLHYLFSSALSDSKRVFSSHWIDSCFGFECISSQTSTNITSSAVYTAANAYSNCVGKRISDINTITLTGTVPDDINVQIYAR